MVFGWGKKKQVEEPVERKPVNQNISLSEVPKIIDDLSIIEKGKIKLKYPQIPYIVKLRKRYLNR